MRARPKILWAVDPVALRVAKGFVSSDRIPAAEAELLHLFEPQQDSAREFRSLIGMVGERAKRSNLASEPNVILLAAAFAPGARERLGLVEQLSRTLEIALPGSQSIYLVIFIPPAIAEDKEKLEMFEFFLGLEEIVGQVPFLNIIFVHELTLDLYKAIADQTDDTDLNPEISELLFRGLLDSEANHTVQDIGYSAIRNGVKVAGRKCCFSTVGSYQLDYLQPEGMAYLRAKFQSMLFHQGLMNLSSLSEKELATIQARADRFIEKLISTWAPQIPETVPFSGDVLTTPDWEKPIQDQIPSLMKEIDRERKKRQQDLLKKMKSLDDLFQNELVTFLKESSGCLAAASKYLDALNGNPLILPDPKLGEGVGSFSGMVLFERKLSFEPMVLFLAGILRETLEGIRFQEASLDLSREEEESVNRWITRILGEVGPLLEDLPPRQGYPLRLLVQTVRSNLHHLQQDRCSPSKAEDLLSNFTVFFGGEASRLWDAVKEKREEIERAEAALKEEFNWLNQTFTKRDEYNEKRGEIERLTEASRELEAAFVPLKELFLTIVKKAALPYLLKADILQKVRDELNQTDQTFSNFWKPVKGAVDTAWERASHLPQYRTSIRGTVLTEEKAEALFQTALQRRGMAEFAKELFTFFPQAFVLERGQKLSYQGCHDIGDHFSDYVEQDLAGSSSLLDRMAHYAYELFMPVESLDIIDIIEMDGERKAFDDVKGKVDQSNGFLPFSPGMLPMVQNQRAMQTIFLVRCAGGNESRLASKYAHAFEPLNRFIDNKDPNVIQITCLIFGFPAFLIHPLQECRRLAQAGKDITAPDLWPETR